MSEKQQALSDAIQALVAEKTFSLEGVQAIEAIRAKALQMEKALAQKEEDIKHLEARNVALETARESLSKDVSAWEARATALKTAEEAARKAIMDGAVAQAESKVWEKSCGLMFRNLEVRENLRGLQPFWVPGQNGSVGYAQTGETRTEVSREQK